MRLEDIKNCYECPLNTGEYTPNEYEKRYCAVTGHGMRKKDYKRSPVDCPLKIWRARIEKIRELHDTYLFMTTGINSDYDTGHHIGFVDGLKRALFILEGKEDNDTDVKE